MLEPDRTLNQLVSRMMKLGQIVILQTKEHDKSEREPIKDRADLGTQQEKKRTNLNLCVVDQQWRLSLYYEEQWKSLT